MQRIQFIKQVALRMSNEYLNISKMATWRTEILNLKMLRLKWLFIIITIIINMIFKAYKLILQNQNK